MALRGSAAAAKALFTEDSRGSDAEAQQFRLAATPGSCARLLEGIAMTHARSRQKRRLVMRHVPSRTAASAAHTGCYLDPSAHSGHY